MNPIFEVKYLNVKWYDENEILKITESIFNIPIEKENENEYNIEIFAYKKIKDNFFRQVAFYFFDEDIEPFFIDANDNKIPLIKAKNPENNKIWWIENGELNPIKKYKYSELIKHVGTAKIVIGDIICNIHIRTNSFNRKELDLYLNDFKNDFWYLILKEDSLTKGKAKNKEVTILNEETINLINKFIEFSEKILDNPKKELKEIQTIKEIKKVKPVVKTFIEIATKGYQKNLTSRGNSESYDVAENRFIYYILDRVYNIIFHILKVSDSLEKIFQRKLEFDKKRIESFSNILKIDKEVFENEMEFLEDKIIEDKINLKNSILQQDYRTEEELKQELEIQNEFLSKIDYAIRNQLQENTQNSLEKFIIRLDKRQNDFRNQIQFWGKIKNINSKEWDEFLENDSLSLEFNEIFDCLNENQEYEIWANTTYHKYNKNKSNGVIHKIFFNNIQKLNPTKILTYETVTIKTSSINIYNNQIQCQGEVKLPNGEWYKFKNNDFFSFEFDENIFRNAIKSKTIYKFSAYIEKWTQPWEKDNRKGLIYKRYFKYIKEIELINSSYKATLKKLKSEEKNLEKINWQRPLTPNELEEQIKEEEALKKSIELLKNNQNSNSNLIKKLQPKIDKLKTLLNKCKQLKIKKDSYFPNSMTFIQNPNYQGAYNFYKKINKIVGIDENLFIQMQLVEEIGLLDIPTIYERWCYLQIIKVLIDKFRFQPESNWKIKLATQIVSNLDNIRDIKIKFKNEDIKMEIELFYEKTLPNKKRPDFILDILSTPTNKQHRLIMDAKFHEQVDIKYQIEKLYKNKNYSENNKNSVFILHPDKNSIKKRRTPQSWGNDAYYGELNMFNFKWDKDNNPNHKYGAILLSPINDKGNYLDNLQRLIGMNLQYNLETNNQIIEKPIDPKPSNKVFCIVCGSNKFSVKKYPTKNNKGYRYQLTCDNCNHLYIYNYCWSCKNRLIKNGVYWTYHSNKILQPFNIKCPSCGEYFYN